MFSKSNVLHTHTHTHTHLISLFESANQISYRKGSNILRDKTALTFGNASFYSPVTHVNTMYLF